MKLKKEEDHLRKLINIVKPTSMPELKPFMPVKKDLSVRVKEISNKTTEYHNPGSAEKSENPAVIKDSVGNPSMKRKGIFINITKIEL